MCLLLEPCIHLYSSLICFFLYQVVQKKDSHDYRCLFRVCFIPRDPTDMLQEDPSAFEYFFLQVGGKPLLIHSSNQKPFSQFFGSIAYLPSLPTWEMCCVAFMHYGGICVCFQSVGDVLRERFALEMKCNTALRLAALHMHERLDSCGNTRTSIKSITWVSFSFMRGTDSSGVCSAPVICGG